MSLIQKGKVAFRCVEVKLIYRYDDVSVVTVLQNALLICWDGNAVICSTLAETVCCFASAVEIIGFLAITENLPLKTFH